MTTSLPFSLSTNTSSLTTAFQEELNEIVDLLTEKSPLDFGIQVSKIPLGLIEYFRSSLIHWIQQLPKKITSLFLSFKILETLSFWSGYFRSSYTIPHSQKSFQDLPEILQPELIEPQSGIIIIPTNREDPSLTTLIRNCTQCNSIKHIIIVEDNVTVTLPTHKKLHKVHLSHPSGPAMARNIGIKIAQDIGADSIIFLDSDVIITPDQIQYLLENLRKAFSIAPLIKSGQQTLFDWYHDFNGHLNGRYYRPYKLKDILLYAPSCCLAVRSSLFDQGFQFNSDFKQAASEDIDFCLRLFKQGYPTHPLDTLSVEHFYGYQQHFGTDIQTFFERFSRYGQGERYLLSIHPDYYYYLDQTHYRPSNHTNNIDKPRPV